MARANTPFFFDIETGGFNKGTSSIFSISFGTHPRDVQTFYAQPTQGTFVSRWSEKNVWEPIKALQGVSIESEESILKKFLGTLQGLPEGQVVTGWNIGYTARPSGRGFDIPMLMARAERYGLGGEYRKAFQKLAVRDIGQEYAYRMAKELMPYEYLVGEGKLPETIYGQAKGYAELGLKYEAGRPATERQAARYLAEEFKYMTGWKQELAHEMFVGGQYRAHMSAADVASGLGLAERFGKGPLFRGEKEVITWGREALYKSLVSQAMQPAGIREGVAEVPTEKYPRLLAQAAEMERTGGEAYRGFSKRVISGIESEASQRGAQISDILAGKGVPETGRWVGREAPKVAEAFGLPGWVRKAPTLFWQHKWKVIPAAAVLGLYATQPLSWFSGKDDNYNTIEGLRHGGEAERMRRLLTDFGSGWIKAALSRGISPKTVLSRVVRSEVGTGVSGLTKAQFWKQGLREFEQGGEAALTSFIRSSQRVTGDTERFLITKAYRAGGFGQTFRAEGLSTGRQAIYKQAKLTEEGVAVGAKTIDEGAWIAGPAVTGGARSQGELIKNLMSKQQYIQEYMGQLATSTAAQGTRGITPAYEAAMQRAARKEMGDIVPEVLGVTDKGFIQEFAGVPLPAVRESIPAVRKAMGMWEEALMSGKTMVRHFDPQIENVVRQGTRLRPIDYGVAAKGGPLSPKAQLQAKESLDQYIARMTRELDPYRGLPAPKPGANAFSGFDDATNVIEGFGERGLAPTIRKDSTPFGSGFIRNLFSKMARPFTYAGKVERLYKKAITGSLRAQGISTRGMQWSYVDIMEQGVLDITMMAKSRTGQPLAMMSRSLSPGEVYLTSIEVGTKGAGLGKQLYARESQVLRKLGYGVGTTVTSPISNPITARWQAQLYHSAPVRPHGSTFFEDLLQKKIAHDEFQKKYAGEFVGKIQPLPNSVVRKKVPKHDMMVAGTVESTKRRASWFKKHKESMVRASANASNPGKRHINQTGKPVL